MPNDAAGSSKRVLDPIDRLSEILFGLIMVLTFTGSLNVAEGGRENIRTMLIGALGCNLAWGFIDGVFYLMGCMAERGRALLTLRAVRSATDLVEALDGRGDVGDGLAAIQRSDQVGLRNANLLCSDGNERFI